MSSPLITIESKLSASEAVDIMLQNNVRHLLVVDNESSEDLNKPIALLLRLTLLDLKATQVVTIMIPLKSY